MADIANNPPPVEQVRFLFDYNPETGAFTRRVRVGQRGQVGKSAAFDNGRYLRIHVKGRAFLAHRLAWLYVHGTWPGCIDHINGDPRDNRLCNLRDMDAAGLHNQQNHRRAQPRNQTGFLGVQLTESGRFAASIFANGRVVYLGRYDTAEAAHQVYVDAKRRLHPAGTL